MMTNPLLPVRFGLFAALNLGDLLLTGYLVLLGHGLVYEANPLARWWLDRFGLAGLAVFKGGVVLAVAALVWAVARRRPRAAGRFPGFACLVVAGVLGYSALLAARELPDLREVARQEEKALRYERQTRDGDAYRALLDQLTRDLVAGRVTAAGGADLLADTDKAQDPAWLACLRFRYPGLPDRACLAANLVEYTFQDLVLEPGHRAALAGRVRAELRSAFGGRVVRLLPALAEAPSRPGLTRCQCQARRAARLPWGGRSCRSRGGRGRAEQVQDPAVADRAWGAAGSARSSGMKGFAADRRPTTGVGTPFAS